MFTTFSRSDPQFLDQSYHLLLEISSPLPPYSCTSTLSIQLLHAVSALPVRSPSAWLAAHGKWLGRSSAGSFHGPARKSKRFAALTLPLPTGWAQILSFVYC